MPRPPRRPRRPSLEQDPEPEPKRARSEAPTSPSASNGDSDPSPPSSTHLPIFNTTFSLHRVSPLYIGPTGLPPSRLTTLSTRLRDLLVGDVVRGIDLGTCPDTSITATAGALLAVRLTWISAPALLGEGDGRRALQIELDYENASSSGFLLPSSPENPTEAGHNFVSLPLMLLRMPASVKSAVVEFLASTFDCRVTPLRLGSADISRCWEARIREAGLPRRGPLAKDCVITVAFDVLGAMEGVVDGGVEADDGVGGARGRGLKSVDIVLPNKDLRKFTKAGDALLGTGAGTETQPFMRALKEYGKQHLALDLGHPAVKLMRIACGGFVMGGERLKIFPLDEESDEDAPHLTAVRGLLKLLIARAGE